MDRPRTSSLRERLKTETRAQHLEAEDKVRLADRLTDARQYTELLIRMFGFYEPVEARLRAAHGDALSGLDLTARRRAPLLGRDLRALGLSPDAVAALPRCPECPDVTSLPAALGYLYVTEGSALGGALIARQLAARGIGPDSGASVFSIYGDRVGERWKEFLAALDGVTSAAEADTVVESARDTFARYTRWIGGAI